MSINPAQQICDAISILTTAEILDFNGHVSIRDPKGGFWINTGASNRANMTPDQVCHVDVDGQPDGNSSRPPNETALHTKILANNPKINAVVHGHPKWSTIFTLTRIPIPVVMPQGCLVANLPIYPNSHSISTSERGQAVSDLLGTEPGILLAGHGSVLTGKTLIEATALAIYTELNAERAYLAQNLGQPTAIPSVEHTMYCEGLAKKSLYEKCWQFYLNNRS